MFKLVKKASEPEWDYLGFLRRLDNAVGVPDKTAVAQDFLILATDDTNLSIGFYPDGLVQTFKNAKERIREHITSGPIVHFWRAIRQNLETCASSAGNSVPSVDELGLLALQRAIAIVEVLHPGPTAAEALILFVRHTRNIRPSIGFKVAEYLAPKRQPPGLTLAEYEDWAAHLVGNSPGTFSARREGDVLEDIAARIAQLRSGTHT